MISLDECNVILLLKYLAEIVLKKTEDANLSVLIS